MILLGYVLGLMTGILVFPLISKGVEKVIYDKAVSETLKGLHGNYKKAK